MKIVSINDRRRPAEIEMARRAARVRHPAELPRESDAEVDRRERWAERKLADALTVYRSIFGSQLLLDRLQLAEQDEEPLAMEGIDGRQI